MTEFAINCVGVEFESITSKGQWFKINVIDFDTMRIVRMMC